LAWQLEQAMQDQRKTKQAMARQLRTSRSQLDRLLDPKNVSVTLDTITRAARALGKRVSIRVADRKAKRARSPLTCGGKECVNFPIMPELDVRFDRPRAQNERIPRTSTLIS
jgi:hypothetical protein